MGKAKDQFRQKDVTFWGMTALVCAALAVLAGNLSAVLPENVMAGLHATRQSGASLSQLRAQVAALQQEQGRLRSQSAEIATRLDLGERASGQITQRVGALEVTVPSLLEALPPGAEVDRSAVTASIGEDRESREVEGGSLETTIVPLPELNSEAAPQQPLPELPAEEAAEPEPERVVFGVAIGPAVGPNDARSKWSEISGKLGPLLLGLEPRLVGSGDTGRTLVAGPITELSQASELCRRLERASIACLPVPFGGDPLAEQGSGDLPGIDPG